MSVPVAGIALPPTIALPGDPGHLGTRKLAGWPGAPASVRGEPCPCGVLPEIGTARRSPEDSSEIRRAPRFPWRARSGGPIAVIEMADGPIGPLPITDSIPMVTCGSAHTVDRLTCSARRRQGRVLPPSGRHPRPDGPPGSWRHLLYAVSEVSPGRRQPGGAHGSARARVCGRARAGRQQPRHQALLLPARRSRRPPRRSHAARPAERAHSSRPCRAGVTVDDGRDGQVHVVAMPPRARSPLVTRRYVG